MKFSSKNHTKICEKHRNDVATCALCNDKEQTENYKGCAVYKKKLIQRKKTTAVQRPKQRTGEIQNSTNSEYKNAGFDKKTKYKQTRADTCEWRVVFRGHNEDAQRFPDGNETTFPSIIITGPKTGEDQNSPKQIK